ncbi:MAG: hypothetical protein ACRDHY_02785, partial [Anaerolineales bacterium]
MSAVRAEEAAKNNAFWCDAVCRAHGKPGVFADPMWWNPNSVPQFYSNGVTLARGKASSFQRDRVRELVSAPPSPTWSVKDSFCTLDLAPMGFSILFEATWLSRSADLGLPDRGIEGIQWGTVKDDQELARWEASWGGSVEPTLQPEGRVFRSGLLGLHDIVFVAGDLGDRIVAGAIANRSGGVVGISNVFAPAEDAGRHWAACVAQ